MPNYSYLFLKPEVFLFDFLVTKVYFLISLAELCNNFSNVVTTLSYVCFYNLPPLPGILQAQGGPFDISSLRFIDLN